jgi:hypothetical protein
MRTQAIDQLDEAVSLEESLGYMEPPRLHQPARQCLGWVLLRAGKAGEAADTYHQVRSFVEFSPFRLLERAAAAGCSATAALHR